MSTEAHKVTADHLRRDAYLYVRQSTLRQVMENTESTQRQYALRERAVALGWPLDRVVVIDSDQGQSGADSDREGFQRLVAEVGMGRAGIVLGLEVSRLARNSSDWHRLLEICALSHTLILDEDGLYDPQHFNDRLVLGLKGTMSEAELHILRARLQGGIRNKARRGELLSPLPVGLVYDEQGRVALDPDRQVRQALANLFATFQRTASALATVKHFHSQGWLFPRRARGGSNRGELLWGPLGHCRTLQILHNPRYAGAYVFGRTRSCRTGAGKLGRRNLPAEQWQVLLQDAFAGYLDWEQYQDNQRRLRDNARTRGPDRQVPPGRGCALLQGIALCGLCGERMTVRYHHRFGRIVPEYVCQRRGIERGTPLCQSVQGHAVDAAVGQLLVQKLSPALLDLSLAVQQEVQARCDEGDRLRRQQVERARYEAELARRRFLQVDPDHRLVADTLEAEWNDKLRACRAAEDACQRQGQKDHVQLTGQLREEIHVLATDFSRLWNDERTPDRDRKRMLRLLIDDVTLVRDKAITAHVRFKGGSNETLQVDRPLTAWELRKTRPEVLTRLNELLDGSTEEEAARHLNEEGWESGTGKPFTAQRVIYLRRAHGLRSRFDRLRDRGMLTAGEVAVFLGVGVGTVGVWRRHGLLRGHPFNEKGECLYERPGPGSPRKQQGQKLAERRRAVPLDTDQQDEV